MDIYLDIDGVLRGCSSPIEDRIALLRYIMDTPGLEGYWLTTHCKHGENRACEALSAEYPPEFLEKLNQKIHPTEWSSLKTDALNFEHKFLWLDDTFFVTERMILKGHGVTNSILVMEPTNPNAAKNALNIIKQRSAGLNA